MIRDSYRAIRVSGALTVERELLDIKIRERWIKQTLFLLETLVSFLYVK
jgi:hypothetical protein